MKTPKAIKGFNREELFITSKLALGQVTTTWPLSQVENTHIEESVEATCDQALKELKIDYLDLFLIHWPDRARPLEAILAAMHKLTQSGKLRYVGVSNFTMHHLQNAFDANLKVAFNQVEFHPYLYQKELLDFCNAHKN